MIDTIYQIAKASIGKRLTLNPDVPASLGCAEAVSTVLKQANVSGIPQEGFAGTYALYNWLLNSGLFVPTTTPTSGTIIISPTGTSSKNSPHGHVGICGIYGILSNDSNNGLFLEVWTIEKWNEYYRDLLGFPVLFFNAK